uniref:NADH dehydrogenase [ubiquinone] 1 alpha subcomplex subunit 3 n=3 Tax=Canis lupus TaxID=9612 RepID=A0A8C0TYA7_CANLF
MARRLVAFFKHAWAKEPVLVVSFTIEGHSAVLLTISPLTKYTTMINQATPYNYPVPLRDHGYMPNMPWSPA